MLLRALLVLISGLLLAPAVRAHSPGESSLVLAADDENLTLRFTLSLRAAAGLLGAEATPPLSAATFEQHRDTLREAAARACVLLGANGRPLDPERVLVSLHEGPDLRFDFIFAAGARPAALRLPVLSNLGPEAWCLVSDLRFGDPVRAVLSAKSAELSLSAAR